jgi:CRISPR-associated protein Cas5t
MEAAFTVELVAEAPGDFVGEVNVKTETNVFCLSVSAKVLPAAAEEPTAVMQQQAAGGGGDGSAAGRTGEGGETAVGGV